MKPFDKYCSTLSDEALMAACSRIRHVALDMDGTIYMGSTLFPCTIPFLEMLREKGIGYSFLTNNPTRSTDDYLKKLEGLGIHTPREAMTTSAVSTIDYIRLHHPEARRLFLLGTPSMVAEFEAAGFEAAADSADDRPDLLVVAFDTTLTYSRLCRAAWWAAQGIPYIATNPDRVCPTDQPTVLVDCGSLCRAIEHATGRCPDVVIGKPNPGMLQVIRAPRRSPCAATGSTPTCRRRSMPEASACWSSRAKRPSKRHWPPTRSRPSRCATSASSANCCCAPAANWTEHETSP